MEIWLPSSKTNSTQAVSMLNWQDISLLMVIPPRCFLRWIRRSIPGDYWRESYRNPLQIIQNKSLRTVSTYKMVGYKTATKFARNLCTARNTWIIWTKSVSRVHFITLNQSPRLEWECEKKVNMRGCKALKTLTFWKFIFPFDSKMIADTNAILFVLILASEWFAGLLSHPIL